MIKSCKVYACPNGMLGLNLTRAPWDPYPWISSIQSDSSAAQAGMRTGDTVLEINDCDVLGQRIVEIAESVREHWKSGAAYVTMVIWRNKDLDTDEEDAAPSSGKENGRPHINQHSLQKFATCLQHISQLLECPVCLEISRPPSWQCCNGHVLCNNCRSRSVKCPVCRVALGPRGRCLLADKLYHALAESFPNESGRSDCKLLTANRKDSSQRSLETMQSKEHPKRIWEAEFLKKLKSKRHGIKTTATTTSEQPQSQVQRTPSNNNNNFNQQQPNLTTGHVGATDISKVQREAPVSSSSRVEIR